MWSSVLRTIASGLDAASWSSFLPASAGRGVAAVLVEQEDEVHRLGELGPSGILRIEAEAAVLGVELLGQLRAALGGRTARVSGACRLPFDVGERAADDLGEPVGRLLDLGPLVAPGVGHPGEDRREPADAVAVLGGEVGAAEEGAAVGGQEHRHRPAAVAERLERGHVDLVDVGPLLAVDLDADELLVQELGDLPGP